MKRRSVLAFAPLLALSACGFQLRGSTNLSFSTLYVAGSETSAFVVALKRQIAATTSTRIAPDAQSAQAVFTLLGDLHESGQTASGHLHDVSAHETTMAAQGQDDDSKLLHALMHASHCCGHLTGIVAGTHWLPLPLVAADAPAHEAAARPLSIPVNHFRPPITA